MAFIFSPSSVTTSARPLNMALRYAVVKALGISVAVDTAVTQTGAPFFSSSQRSPAPAQWKYSVLYTSSPTTLTGVAYGVPSGPAMDTVAYTDCFSTSHAKASSRSHSFLRMVSSSSMMIVPLCGKDRLLSRKRAVRRTALSLKQGITSCIRP